LKRSSAPLRDRDAVDIDLVDLFATIWTGKWLILFAALCGLACGLVFILITPPIYQANALLQIESNSTALAVPKGLADLMGSSSKASGAELELLHARLTLGTAVAKMHLDWIAQPVAMPLIGYAITGYNLPFPDWPPFSRYARKHDAIQLSFLKVPPEWLGLKIPLSYKGSGAFSITLPDGSALDGQLGKPLLNDAQTFAVTVQNIQSVAGREFTLQQVSELTAVDMLNKTLADTEQGRDTGVIRVTLNGPDPDINRQILDGILDAFHGQNLSRSSAEAEKSLEFVESQIPQAEICRSDL
jgi:tyrosine-protein kinase Etk/Wzc